MEATAMTRLLGYFKKVEIMADSQWPKITIEEKLNTRKKTWMKQNNEWMSKWGISIHECPSTNEEIKKYVREKFRNTMLNKQLGRKREYHVKKFNPTCDHEQKHYIGATIKWKAKMLIVQLKTSSHHLRCETGRWKMPKEEWSERVCQFCKSGTLESEWHFVMECVAYGNIRRNCMDILTSADLTTLFEEEKVAKTTDFLINIHSKQSKINKELEK
ncbi:hypothetical protein KI387_000418, partial [Taxus chinensis]